ncbi:hypothetical protein HMPREF9080_01027 [Cardiobacterium valvarum F0432]|uniref:Uncharacterized protein n=1 Tax=Cardiobacterium valvarum F0432 TaxID=797473 RepID=G9ZE44_9GAMM|nr:hypothetical protein HMPREF9080_01027 [Cardiobacterium valvarum F0432]
MHILQRCAGKDDVGRLRFTFERFQGQCRSGEVIVDINDDTVATISFRRHRVNIGLGGVAQIDNDAQGGLVAEAGADAVYRTGADSNTRPPAAAGIRNVKNDARRSGEAELLKDRWAVKIKNELDFVRQAVIAYVL